MVARVAAAPCPEPHGQNPHPVIDLQPGNTVWPGYLEGFFGFYGSLRQGGLLLVPPFGFPNEIYVSGRNERVILDDLSILEHEGCLPTQPAGFPGEEVDVIIHVSLNKVENNGRR